MTIFGDNFSKVLQYRVEREQVVVVIIGVGRRKQGDKRDIYTVIEGLLEE